MAKIYDRNQPGREYRAPVESVKAQKRAMAILVALILGLVVVLLLYRMARGEELHRADLMTSSTFASSFYSG